MLQTYYHVVFFDETSVTRAWVNLKNIAPYTKNGTKYKQVSKIRYLLIGETGQGVLVHCSDIQGVR